VIKFACAIETIIREKGLGQLTWAKEKPEAPPRLPTIPKEAATRVRPLQVIGVNRIDEKRVER
jgi:hypothetical protein